MALSLDTLELVLERFLVLLTPFLRESPFFGVGLLDDSVDCWIGYKFGFC